MTDNTPPTLREPSIGVHRFSDRLAARPMDDILRREVDDNLAGTLFDWLGCFSTIGIQLVFRAVRTYAITSILQLHTH